MFRRLREDVNMVFERDPAAKSTLEVVLTYPGLHALWFYRSAHRLYLGRHYVLARLMSQFARFVTGIEIHPGARIGRRLFIDHGTGVVIGETAEVGDDVTLYQGVTLGGTGKEHGKRHPTIGNRVMISAGARVLGAITIGDDCKIGAGAVVVKPVPPHCTVVGIPGRIVRIAGQPVAKEVDLQHGDLPDPVTEAILSLTATIDRLEARIAELEGKTQHNGIEIDTSL
ncbi:MAG: serine O-acetyltransferase [Thermaerobacter sp.]|nr:serine O-acetyltransferase [Thermaerobacter sp.]